MVHFPSKYLSEFLNFISEVQSCYIFCEEEMKKQDKLTQDYLHSLELDNLRYKERSKIATRLSTNRKDRRYYKDRIEELAPIIDFFSKPGNQKVINDLKQLLGVVRKEENYHKNRIYIPKILNDNNKTNKDEGK